MRRLTLARHANASWNDAGLSDFDRPLNNRGLRDAPFMAKRLAALERKPDLIVSSPAVRALTTARHYAECLPDIRFREDPRIYDASTHSLIQVVCELGDDSNHALLVGHNPGFSDLACWLATCPFQEMPTGAFAVIELNIANWSEISGGCGRLLDYLDPKDGENRA